MPERASSFFKNVPHPFKWANKIETNQLEFSLRFQARLQLPLEIFCLWVTKLRRKRKSQRVLPEQKKSPKIPCLIYPYIVKIMIYIDLIMLMSMKIIIIMKIKNSNLCSKSKLIQLTLMTRYGRYRHGRCWWIATRTSTLRTIVPIEPTRNK